MVLTLQSVIEGNQPQCRGAAFISAPADHDVSCGCALSLRHPPGTILTSSSA